VRTLHRPAIEYRQLYKQAIAQTQRNADREILEDLEDRMVQAADDYVAVMGAQGPSAITQIALTPLEDSLVSVLYDKRIVAKDGACRTIYDEIRTSAAHCPFCLDGEVYEVDHFLPQVYHHDVVMYPGNLVPICHPCNHIKLHERPLNARESLLHPYFDRLPTVEWLFATLDRHGNGPVLNYHVLLDETLYGNIAPRLAYHFRTLELDRRMRELSAKVLVELQADVEDHLQVLQPAGLKIHFAGEAEKRYQRHGNTLEAAAYRAASVDNQFCEGAYRN
jgi:hypothetical protein